MQNPLTPHTHATLVCKAYTHRSTHKRDFFFLFNSWIILPVNLWTPACVCEHAHLYTHLDVLKMSPINASYSFINSIDVKCEYCQWRPWRNVWKLTKHFVRFACFTFHLFYIFWILSTNVVSLHVTILTKPCLVFKS